MTDGQRLAILISGYGSNLQAVLDAIDSERLPGAQTVIVVSDRADAYGLERARLHGITALHFPYPSRDKGRQSRRERDGELATLLQEFEVDWVVLAGWLRILSSEFLRHYPIRVVNVHPALPGQFPGLNAIERAFEASRSGQIRETGVTIHLVPNEAVDAGPIILSESISIHPEDSLESLTERTHRVEHRLLVAALSQLLSESEPH
jgi:phosphoribosylglycinamide formyltransferase-1